MERERRNLLAIRCLHGVDHSLAEELLLECLAIQFEVPFNCPYSVAFDRSRYRSQA